MSINTLTRETADAEANLSPDDALSLAKAKCEEITTIIKGSGEAETNDPAIIDPLFSLRREVGRLFRFLKGDQQKMDVFATDCGPTLSLASAYIPRGYSVE